MKKNIWKILLVMMLVLAVVFTLAACDDGNDNDGNGDGDGNGATPPVVLMQTPEEITLEVAVYDGAVLKGTIKAEHFALVDQVEVTTSMKNDEETDYTEITYVGYSFKTLLEKAGINTLSAFTKITPFGTDGYGIEVELSNFDKTFFTVGVKNDAGQYVKDSEEKKGATLVYSRLVSDKDSRSKKTVAKNPGTIIVNAVTDAKTLIADDFEIKVFEVGNQTAIGTINKALLSTLTVENVTMTTQNSKGKTSTVTYAAISLSNILAALEITGDVSSVKCVASDGVSKPFAGVDPEESYFTLGTGFVTSKSGISAFFEDDATSRFISDKTATTSDTIAKLVVSIEITFAAV